MKAGSLICGIAAILHWMMSNPALDDVNVRRALVMLFNRDQINADLNLGLVQTGSSFWENTPYQRPDAAPIPYDPAMAAQLLDEAGWVDSNGDGTRDKDGVELVLRYVTNQRQLRKDIQAFSRNSRLRVSESISRILTQIFSSPATVKVARFRLVSTILPSTRRRHRSLTRIIVP